MEDKNVWERNKASDKSVTVDADMLRQIEQSNEEQARYAKKQYHMSLIGAVCAVIILILVAVSTLYILPMAEDTYAQVNQIMSEVSEKVNEMDMDSLNTAIKDVSGQVKSMNIEELNRAIKNLSDIMEPLARFFR